jgi:hypothetical protein
LGRRTQLASFTALRQTVRSQMLKALSRPPHSPALLDATHGARRANTSSSHASLREARFPSASVIRPSG